MSLPDLPLPTPGQRHWAEPLNESLELLNDRLGSFNDLLAEAHPEELSDSFIADRISTPGTQTAEALNVAFAARAGVSPMDFGAVGDGVTDDLTALTNAVNSGITPVLIDRPYFTSGHVTITTPGVTVEGVNGGELISNGLTNTLRVRADNVTIRGVRFKGGHVGVNLGGYDLHPTGLGTGPRNSIVTDCYFDGVGACIRAVFASDIVITNNVGEDVAQCGVEIWGGDADLDSPRYIGNNIYGASNITVSNNQFTGRGMDVPYVDPGTGEAGPTAGIWGGSMTDVVFSNNVVRDFFDVGIDMERTRRGSAIGNVAINIGNGGLACFFGGEDVIFANNIVDWTTPPPVERARQGVRVPNRPGAYNRLVIANNILNCDTARIAIEVETLQQMNDTIVIRGNQIFRGSILVNNTDNLVIQDNDINRGDIETRGGFAPLIAGNKIQGSGTKAPIYVRAGSLGDDPQRYSRQPRVVNNTVINRADSDSPNTIQFEADPAGNLKKGIIAWNILTNGPVNIPGSDTSNQITGNLTTT